MRYFKRYRFNKKINNFIFTIVLFWTAVATVNISAQQLVNHQSYINSKISNREIQNITGENESSNKLNLYVTVLDSSGNKPMELVNLILQKDLNTVAVTITNPHGKAVFHDLKPGRYTLLAHYIGYKDFLTNLILNNSNKNFTVLMKEKAIGLGEVIIKGSKTIHVSSYVDVKTGNQIFLGETYHAAPVDRMTHLILQNVTGAAKAPTGQIVIRDQHDEYSSSTYYVDGVPIPMGVLGDLNEIIDPKTIQRITFYTGGFPAEYGGQSAAVFDIKNHVPPGEFHLSLSNYLGSYLTSKDQVKGNLAGEFKSLNSDGQSISISQNLGNFGYFLSGSRQETDRRIDQPVERLFNDHGFDYFSYGKLDYLFGKKDYITSNLSYSNTFTQVPFDPKESINYDTQNSYNTYQTLSWYHTFSNKSNQGSQILVTLYSSERGIKYTTSNKFDQMRQFLDGDTTNSYTVDQNRKFTTYGTRVKYSNSISSEFSYQTGFRFSATSANELFRFKDFEGDGPVINANYISSNFGVFFQTQIYPLESVLLEAGARYDQSISPSIPLQKQVSPRVKLSYYVNGSNTIYLSYDRLFLPTKVEGLMPISNLIGDSAKATYPEKDNLYEAGLIHNFGIGFTGKLDYFHKDATPGLDDESLGSSSIIINVNIGKVKTSGMELSLSYSNPDNPLSGYINGSIIHAYGQGLISGGFLPSEYSATPFDLDHDQRLTLVIGLNYQPNNWFANITARYGSGLTNGNDDYKFKTGLYDLNQGAHTTPAWIFNLSFGYTFNISDVHSIESSIYITNLFDHLHLIKGAFFNNAYFEEPRNVVFKLTYKI